MDVAEEIETPNTAELIEAKTTTALAVVTQSIAEFNALEAVIGELEHQYKGVVFKVETTAGMKEAAKAREIIRAPRYKLQNMQKDAKKPLNALKVAIDEQAESVIARIKVIEDPIHEQITNEEKRKEAEKEAKRVAEQQRQADIEERINAMRESVTLAAGKSAAEIEACITDLVAIDVDESFAEFKLRAETAKAATLARLRAAHTTAANLEAAQKKLAEEQAELARQRAEQEEAQRIRDEQAARDAEVLRQQREAQEAEAARVKAAQDARDAEAAEQRRVENEEADRVRQRNEMAMQEISAIQHQLLIAEAGRAPYCKGGDLHSYDWLIEETEKWPITEDKFGVLTASAQRVKDSTLNQLKAGRESLIQRLAETEATRVERERLAAEQAERERVQAEQDAARWAEDKRISDQRAQLERDEEALRLRLEAAAAPPPPVVEPVATETAPDVEPVPAVSAIDLPVNEAAASEFAYVKPPRPTDEAIIHVLMTTYGESLDTIIDWLRDMDLSELVRSAA